MTTQPNRRTMTEVNPNDEELDRAYQQALKYGHDLARTYIAEKARREDLEAANELLNAVFVSTPDALLVLNLDLTIQQANPAFYQLINHTNASLEGATLPETTLGSWLENLVMNLQTEDHLSGRAEIALTEPAERDLLANVARLDSPAGQGWVIVLHNRTREKQAERALRQANDDLEQRVEERTAALEKAHIAEREQARRLAVLEERQRLARDLHDAVSQTLWSASLLAESLPDLWQEDIAEGEEVLGEMRVLIRGALAEMRTLLLELRPERLARYRLPELLQQLRDSLVGRMGIAMTLDLGCDPELPQETMRNLYRIAQEALNNVVQHANATRVSVSLDCTDAAVTITVTDDGIGFDRESIPAGHMGVGIMVERATEIGARLDIQSAAGRGTTVTVAWPFTQEGN
jgi:signal transduction histidine kinase